MPAPVEGAHHVAKFGDLAVLRPAGGIGGLGRAEGDAVVAPEIAQLFSGERIGEGAIVFVEFMDGQQLDGGDAKLLQIGNLFDEAREGAGLGNAEVGWQVKPRTCSS